MKASDVLALVGGLAMFLYGMNTMGAALEKCAGNRLKTILTRLTSNKFTGFFLGVIVTAIIQSSSATTVMVVGFVNSGLMTLGQSIYIIMGANVGTAVTSWILSLTGISGSAWYISMLKPSSFTPVVALIGIVIFMMAKRKRNKDFAAILLGFAILMFGMEMMSDAVKPLADMPSFTNILTMFSNPIMGVLAGTVLTAITQSSSASVGILQGLCVTGAVTYGAAIPIILGQNIGTCITALISAVGAGKEAKKVAKAHTLINVLGTTILIIPSLFLGDNILNARATPEGIALCHTVFNLLVALVLMPFAKKLLRLA
jgi:phosphate:Na+ symporter